MDRDVHKRAAAEAAAGMVEDGMIVGLGTGSTARFAIDALIRRVREGLSIRAIPTSERSAAQAREGGIPLTGFAEHRRIDVTIDGADEIELGTLNLIKGLGGALLREKIVAAASDRLIIVADEPKLVERLGGTAPVPGGQLYCTDGGNRILDCRFPAIADPAGLDRAIGQIVGVVETGLFIGMARLALVAGGDGVQRIASG